MRNASATDVKNKFGEYLENAISEPVCIHKNGRVVAVILSQKEYERLTALEDAIWAEKAIKAEESGWISPEETIQFLNSRK